MDKGTRAFVDKLKKEYHYMPDKAGIDELLAKGSTSRVLFTLDGKAYGGKEFAGFAAVYPAGTHRQLEAFTVKTILDYENSRLELKHPDSVRWCRGIVTACCLPKSLTVKWERGVWWMKRD